MVQNIDFAPTFMSAAGITVPEDIQGESIMPLLQGKNEEWDREAVYYHYYEYPGVHAVRKHYGIVNEDYKLVKFYGEDIDEWELYDRKKDTLELNNVYNYESYADVVKDLKIELAELRKNTKTLMN